MHSQLLHLTSFLATLLGKAQAVLSQNLHGGYSKNFGADCRCVPGNSCWPPGATWEAFNLTLGGRLIRSEPIALPCYDGQHNDPQKCAYVNEMWPDLFRALRGGGPGFGVVLSAKVKAYPNIDVVTALRVNIAPLEQTPDNSHLLEAVSVLLQSFPGLNRAGFAGFALWFRSCKTVFIDNATSGYTHSIWTIGKGKAEADAAYDPVRKTLSKFKDRLTITEDFKEYGDYWTFYKAELDRADPLGETSVLTSRMITPEAVQNYDRVREAVEVVSGSPDEYTFNLAMIVSGGQVSRTPPTRRRTISKTATAAESWDVKDDITFVKGAALKKLAPKTSGYMNEGDRNDPEYIESFYGTSYDRHLAAKKKYDPSHVFYCPTCVGAEAFVDRPDGALCRA